MDDFDAARANINTLRLLDRVKTELTFDGMKYAVDVMYEHIKKELMEFYNTYPTARL